MPEPREASGIIRAGRNRSGSPILTQRIVRVDVSEAPDGVETATAATDILHGVSMSSIADGANGDIMLTGMARVTAGTSLAAGIRVTSDGTGRAVAASPAGGTNNGFIGVTNTTAANADDIVEVELAGPGSVIQG